jgi:tetratricopeptide (TPR) repeat protein
MYNNIGILYSTQRRFPDAISYYKKGVEILSRQKKRDAKDSLAIAYAYSNIAAGYIELRDFLKADEYINDAEKLNKSLDDKYLSAAIYGSRGAILRSEKKYKEALSHFESALDINREMDDLYGVSLIYQNMGEVMTLQNRTDDAIKYYIQAFRTAEEIGNLDFMALSGKILSELYEKRGDFQQAYQYHRKSAEARDSLLNEEKVKQINELQTLFQFEQKEKEIQLLQKQNRINLLSRNLLMGGLGFALLFGGYLVYSMRVRIRKDRELTLRKQELLTHEKTLSEVELEKSQIRQKQMESELEFKARQLTTHTLNIIQKKKLMERIKYSISEIGKETDKDTARKLNQLGRVVNYSLNVDKDWEEFKLHFENVNSEFFQRLKIQFPELGPSELKLCALIRLNLSIKEIASILNISPGSVKTARYRVRKKLHMETEESLTDFLMMY